MKKLKYMKMLKSLRFILLFIFAFWLLPFSFSYAQDQFVYDANGKRDPFIPLVTPEGRLLNLDTEQAKGTLNLEGIIYDDKGISYAIVNGAVVKIGDTVDGSQVLKIENNKVIFIKDGNPFEQELKEEVK
jgi:hypothetical protein